MDYDTRASIILTSNDVDPPPTERRASFTYLHHGRPESPADAESIVHAANALGWTLTDPGVRDLVDGDAMVTLPTVIEDRLRTDGFLSIVVADSDDRMIEAYVEL